CDDCVGDGCLGDGCVGESYVGEGYVGDGVWAGVGSGDGEDVILEGKVEGLAASNIWGNRATSCPENPFVDLFILLNTFILRDGTEYNLICC
ncbi:hypothetical protein Tco_1387672, partial [Tanacetum coccineum]